ncbi:helix-turn-helix domain-containing protein [Undibacterium sp. Jales W-56]|jgi:transcriptional regulator with XRE-family HTH domain|uniref:helix-turn-helix domain-containing protein n=1 Tax=Undibacterium sp. Jales W-56 TaxID=2897325 RepID=UPI0021D1DE27|nr:helix-turn-helix transcriptional regulator [Undibacterium sp. Jales W-56]MCU6435313.1 helix-turn-helix domain-containing protein [Undibacterium sp. Jales W-56]
MPRLSSKLDSDKKLVRLGAAIRARRKELGVSQEELAIDCGVERSNMGKIERGENNLSILNLVRIAEALNANAADILADASL